jgi:hypothetical protein
VRTAGRCLALAWALCGPLLGADARAEHIRSFESEIEIDPDGRFVVEERIVCDFGEPPGHGLQRDVPVRYGRGLAPDYRISLDVLAVFDGAGRARPYRVSSHGAFRRIHVGDPERMPSGVQEYRLRYSVRRGVLWLEDHDELYWDATGAWPAPIESARATVHLPGAPGAQAVGALCLTGPPGSVETACSTQREEGRVVFAARRALASGEGLRLVVTIPKGVLSEPSDVARLLDRARDDASAASALPLLVLLGMAGLWLHGREPRAAAAIHERYEPPDGMTPAEMGAVLDERVALRDITATLLDLAVRGYLAIHELEARRFLFLTDVDYELRAVRPADAALKGHERRLLAALLGGQSSVRLSALRDSFHAQIGGIETALYRQVSRRGRWFLISPRHVRRAYLAAGIALALAGGLALALGGSGPLALSLAASGALLAVFGPWMPRRTRAGRRAHQQIRGFREFLERVEVDRLERMGKRTLAQFEQVLPYAFVLGAADPWAEAFADLYTGEPSWFHGRGAFEARRFVGHVGRSLVVAGEVMSSRPRSGAGDSGLQHRAPAATGRDA